MTREPISDGDHDLVAQVCKGVSEYSSSGQFALVGLFMIRSIYEIYAVISQRKEEFAYGTYDTLSVKAVIFELTSSCAVVVSLIDSTNKLSKICILASGLWLCSAVAKFSPVRIIVSRDVE